MFGTPDDAVYSVRLRQEYTGGTQVLLDLNDGPLATGHYRLSVGASVADPVGNPLDGDGDGTGGDFYRHEFFVVLPTDLVFEGRSNNGFAAATALEPVEDPAGAGYWVARGQGSVDPAWGSTEWSDPDYWRFEVEAGDLVTLAADTPRSDLDVLLRLYDEAGREQTASNDEGPHADSLISRWVAPTSATYYLAVLKQYWSTLPGAYLVRIDIARGIQQELDHNYRNDAIAQADTLTLDIEAGARQAVVSGTVMDLEGAQKDEDFFGWGTVNAGNTVELDLLLPASSRMVPWVRLVDDQGQPLPDEDGEPLDGHALVTLSQSGNHYAQVESFWSYEGHYYTLTPTARRWVDAEAYAQSLGGHLIAIDNQAEQQWARATFGQIGNFWIGLNNQAGTGTWVWADGKIPTYTNWQAGEPNQGSHTVSYLDVSNGYWYDCNPDWNVLGIVEVDGPARAPGGPGFWAQYLLRVRVTDTVPPKVIDVEGWPASGATSAEPVGSLTIAFSEALDPATANATNPLVVGFGGHHYLLTPTALSWADAEAYATGLGGHLATIDGEVEDRFLTEWFAAAEPWIGLNDAGEEGVWVWASGTPPAYLGWQPGEPNDGDGRADYAYLADLGGWRDGRSTATRRGLVELAGVPDADPDGVPDPLDVVPSDPIDYYDLRERGPDGRFDTADDTVYALELSEPYTTGNVVRLGLADGPLGDGSYRLTLSARLTDAIGTALDGNGDGTAGDPYEHLFTVNLPAGLEFEGRTNGSLAAATPLPMTEDPVGSGFWVGRGIGTVDPARARGEWLDPDWWTFTAQAGDWLAVAMDTPASDVDPLIRIYRSDGTELVGDNNAGPDNDAFVSRYLIPADGAYYIAALKYHYSEVPGSYLLRASLARDLELEADADYGNGRPADANDVTLQAEQGTRRGVVAGTLMAPGRDVVDRDFFGWGTLNAGNVVELSVTLPASSRAVLRVFLVAALEGAGPFGQYLLDLTIAPSGQLDFADLSGVAIQLPASAESGGLLPVQWTAGNFGTATTPASEWLDRLVLSPNEIYGDADDLYLTSTRHAGPLGPQQEYTGQAEVRVPAGAAGTYWLFVELDETDAVFEFVLEGNNVFRSSATVTISLSDYADLEAKQLLAPALAIAGAEASFSWTIANAGPGTTADGAGGVVSQWSDRLVLSRNAAYGDGDDRLLAEVRHDGALGPAGTYSGSWTGRLPAGLSGAYYTFLFTDVRNAVYEYTDQAANLVRTAEPLRIASGPYADLVVGTPLASATARVGQDLAVQWTVTNATNAFGPTPVPRWYDRLILSRDAVLGGADDLNLGDFYHDGTLAVGQSYTGTATVSIPSGWGGSAHLFVLTDARGQVYEFEFDGNNATPAGQALALTVVGPDLVIDGPPAAPATAQFGSTVALSWTVRNTGSETAAPSKSSSAWTIRSWARRPSAARSRPGSPSS